MADQLYTHRDRINEAKAIASINSPEAVRILADVLEDLTTEVNTGIEQLRNEVITLSQLLAGQE